MPSQAGILQSDRAGGETAWSVHERRAAPRRPANFTAQIAGKGLGVPIPCFVRDTSAVGARLSLYEAVDNPLGTRIRLPSNFTLVMRADRVEIDCTIAWRDSGKLGVRYLAPARPISRAMR
jgi:hypothetical protein